jgi:preprotein translocase subunit SecG
VHRNDYAAAASAERQEKETGVINAILIVIHLIICVALIGLILLHSGKDAGMASSSGFSFASQASVMEKNLTRYTIITGILFFITTFLLTWRLS